MNPHQPPNSSSMTASTSFINPIDDPGNYNFKFTDTLHRQFYPDLYLPYPDNNEASSSTLRLALSDASQPEAPQIQSSTQASSYDTNLARFSAGSAAAPHHAHHSYDHEFAVGTSSMVYPFYVEPSASSSALYQRHDVQGQLIVGNDQSKWDAPLLNQVERNGWIDDSPRESAVAGGSSSLDSHSSASDATEQIFNPSYDIYKSASGPHPPVVQLQPVPAAMAIQDKPPLNQPSAAPAPYRTSTTVSASSPDEGDVSEEPHVIHNELANKKKYPCSMCLKRFDRPSTLRKV